MSEERSLGSKLKDLLESVLALKVTDAERLVYAADPMNVFGEDYSNRRPLRVAAIVAVVVHIFLFLFMFPMMGDQVFVPQEVLVLKQLSMPSLPAGGSPPEPEIPRPKPQEITPQPKPILVPIPDPTPLEPEPLVQDEVLDTPNVLDELAADLNIGEITGPPGRGGQGVAGTGAGASSGEGQAAGTGDGVYRMGSGVTNPVVVNQTIPSYTDEAIKAKAQGVVLLQAIIRKDGRVTDFKVLRGLGYGLEEKAIEEIASNWKFLPGRYNGRPVDVLATIEVQFNLR